MNFQNKYQRNRKRRSIPDDDSDSEDGDDDADIDIDENKVSNKIREITEKQQETSYGKSEGSSSIMTSMSNDTDVSRSKRPRKSLFNYRL